ncbi:hypothetical protein PAPHI01_1312 [Pancytospora philotis]|nr:hypothetical protein PAPHI01_1312 [Pancytospora philotis]
MLGAVLSYALLALVSTRTAIDVYELNFAPKGSKMEMLGIVPAKPSTTVRYATKGETHAWVHRLVQLKQYEFAINKVVYTLYPFEKIMQGSKCLGTITGASAMADNLTLYFSGGDALSSDDKYSVLVEVAPSAAPYARRTLYDDDDVRFRFALGIPQLMEDVEERTFQVYLPAQDAQAPTDAARIPEIPNVAEANAHIIFDFTKMPIPQEQLGLAYEVRQVSAESEEPEQHYQEAHGEDAVDMPKDNDGEAREDTTSESSDGAHTSAL